MRDAWGDEADRLARRARGLILAAVGGLIFVALIGIVLTHDAWPMLREALGSLDVNGLSDGVVPTALIVGALVLFAGFALRRSRRIVTGQANVPVGAAWLWGALALFCILMTVASWLQVQSVRRDFRAERFEQQAAVARLKAQQVDDWAYERGIDVQFLVNTLKTLPLDQLDQQPEIRQIADLVMAQFLAGHSERVAVILSRADGQTALEVGTVPPGDRGALVRDIREAARRRTEMRGTIRPGGARPEGLSVAFLVPFAVPARGATLDFVATALIDPSLGLLKKFSAWPNASRSSEIELLFQDGDHVVHIAPAGPTPSAPLSFRFPLAMAPLVTKGLAAPGGVVSDVDHGGQRVLAAVQRIKAFPWIVVAKTDDREAMAALDKQVANIWSMTAAMIFFAGLLVLALWYQLRTIEVLQAQRAKLEEEGTRVIC